MLYILVRQKERCKIYHAKTKDLADEELKDLNDYMEDPIDHFKKCGRIKPVRDQFSNNRSLFECKDQTVITDDAESDTAEKKFIFDSQTLTVLSSLLLKGKIKRFTIIAAMREERSCAEYKIQPKTALLKKTPPITDTTKEGPVLFAALINTSASVLVSAPFL
jgi:hypothetical protein